MSGPLLIVGLVIVVIVDIRSWMAVRFLWQLYREDRATETRIRPPRVTLTLVKAVVATLTATGTTYLIALTSLRLLDGTGLLHVDYAGIAASLSPVTLAVFILLCAAPIVSAEYLRFRRRQAQEAYDAGTATRTVNQTTRGVRRSPPQGLLEEEVGPDLERDAEPPSTSTMNP